MDREFLDHYNRELQLLKEQAREFAEEYPGIAERLGGLLADRMDPMISGLLEGAAFLAARVQLKLKHEFPEFCNNLLEQLAPHYLSPTPSVMLAAVTPPYGDPALRDGLKFPRFSLLDATYRERDRLVSCRFRLTSDIVAWPFEISAAQYFETPAALQALGLAVGANVHAGLRLTLLHRAAARREDEKFDLPTNSDPSIWFSGCKTDELVIHLVGPEADAVGLYEQIHARRASVMLRYLDRFGDPVVIPAPLDCISQIGFAEDERLFPIDHRLFAGFELLREYFVFPRKFLGFRITGLRRLFAGVKARSLDIVIAFDEVNARLAAAAEPRMFALYAAPAINLFEKSLDRIPVRRNQHEYHVVVDRSHHLDYEPHRILDLTAHFAGGRERAPVLPLYSATRDGLAEPDFCYTVRRLPRRRSEEERRFGLPTSYIGTEMFISLVEPAGLDDKRAIVELSVRALCSNRHLTEHMPVGPGLEIRLLDATEVGVQAVAGPTAPRGPVVAPVRGRHENLSRGAVAWRLINMLSLNHLGLVERGAGANALALRETLAMFADTTDSAIERRIRGLLAVDSRPVVRRMRSGAGVGAARGVEITVAFDEKAFEGTGIFLLGAILERFFGEYVSVNHFTQTVIRSVERGEVVRWPVRVGSRRLA